MLLFTEFLAKKSRTFYSVILKINDSHDPRNGQFAPKGGGGKSVSTRADFITAKDYWVKGDAEGQSYSLKKGERIKNVTVIAGGASSKPINVEKFLVEQYKTEGMKGTWAKVTGNATITNDKGVSETRHIHWFEHPQIGIVQVKVKPKGK